MQTVRHRNYLLNVEPGHYIDDLVLSGQPHEPHIAKWIYKYAKPNSTAIDIGANFGYFSVPLGLACGYVICIEPMEICNRISQNLRINRVNGVVLRCAVGNSFYPSVPLRFQHNYGKNEDRIENIMDIYPLDELLKPLNELLKNNPLSIIKLDTDGGEYQVLRGMQETLLRDHFTVIQEFAMKEYPFADGKWTWTKADNLFNWKKTFELYQSWGYQAVEQSLGSEKLVQNGDELVELGRRVEGELSSIDVLFR